MKEMVIPESTATTHAEEVFFEAGEMDFPVDEDGNPAGMFRGPCEFCGKMILPLPSMEMQQSQVPLGYSFSITIKNIRVVCFPLSCSLYI